MSNQTISRESDAVERALDEKALTDREKDAARSLLQGMTAQSAAEAMGVSPSSVGSYRGRAYEKLGVASGRERGCCRPLRAARDAPMPLRSGLTRFLLLPRQGMEPSSLG